MTTQISQDELQNQIRCVSHEIRNHLSICDMYSQIIKKNLEKSGIKNGSAPGSAPCSAQGTRPTHTEFPA